MAHPHSLSVLSIICLSAFVICSLLASVCNSTISQHHVLVIPALFYPQTSLNQARIHCDRETT